MERDLVAKASVTVNAKPALVWSALTTPDVIKRYMFGSTVTTDWKIGSPITWRGEFKGKPFEDKGQILRVEPRKVLSYSHYSPLSGAPDREESYHHVTIELTKQGEGTCVSLSQDKNATEEARQHSEQNWKAMLDNLKQVFDH